VYSSAYWLTYKQATDLGGYVRKGERSTPVIFWKMLDRHNQDQDDETKTTGRIPMLRQYHVFSAEQCEGIAVPPDPEETVNPFTPIERFEQIITGMPNPPSIHYGGNRAFYRPSEDWVQMPYKRRLLRRYRARAIPQHRGRTSTGP